MHPKIQELFDTMLDERLKNIECAPSYELYDKKLLASSK